MARTPIVTQTGGNGGFAVDLQGFDDLVRRLTAIADRGAQVVAEELHEEMEEVLAYSRDELCPIMDGRLRATAYLGPPRVKSGTVVQFEMSYGTDANGTEPAPYALYVHEDVEAYHESPTQAKYLETAIEENKPGLARRVGVRVRTRFRELR